MQFDCLGTYSFYMEDEKQKKECSGRGQKRKLWNDEIDELIIIIISEDLLI